MRIPTTRLTSLVGRKFAKLMLIAFYFNANSSLWIWTSWSVLLVVGIRTDCVGVTYVESWDDIFILFWINHSAIQPFLYAFFITKGHRKLREGLQASIDQGYTRGHAFPRPMMGIIQHTYHRSRLPNSRNNLLSQEKSRERWSNTFWIATHFANVQLPGGTVESIPSEECNSGWKICAISKSVFPICRWNISTWLGQERSRGGGISLSPKRTSRDERMKFLQLSLPFLLWVCHYKT